MTESDQMLALLKEIRDLQEEHLAEYKEQTARSILLAEEGVARQKAIGKLYKKVVFVASIVVIAWTAYVFSIGS